MAHKPQTLNVNEGGTGRQTLTNHGILVGAATTAITQLAAGSSGQVLQSGGASADPAYSTATFPSTATSTGTILRADGTNWAATTATYPASTTSQQILYSTANNVIGQLTTANSKFPATNSSGTLAMRGLSVVVQVFTSNGTYTPTSGMQYCTIEVVGGGGGGGATTTTAANQISNGGGGGGGGYARKTVSAATIGASQSVTVGTGGTAGAVAGGTGGTGNTSSVGAIVSASGGAGGVGGGVGTAISTSGGAGGVGSSGDFNAHGGQGGLGMGVAVAASFALSFSGQGGNAIFGGGGLGITAYLGAGTAGNAGTTYGGGGSGSNLQSSQTQQAGGAGADGIVIITEYVIA